jgi:hypothetical protein
MRRGHTCGGPSLGPGVADEEFTPAGHPRCRLPRAAHRLLVALSPHQPTHFPPWHEVAGRTRLTARATSAHHAGSAPYAGASAGVRARGKRGAPRWTSVRCCALWRSPCWSWRPRSACAPVAASLPAGPAVWSRGHAGRARPRGLRPVFTRPARTARSGSRHTLRLLLRGRHALRRIGSDRRGPLVLHGVTRKLSSHPASPRRPRRGLSVRHHF